MQEEKKKPKTRNEASTTGSEWRKGQLNKRVTPTKRRRRILATATAVNEKWKQKQTEKKRLLRRSCVPPPLPSLPPLSVEAKNIFQHEGLPPPHHRRRTRCRPPTRIRAATTEGKPFWRSIRRRRRRRLPPPLFRTGWSRDPSGLGPVCCDGKGALACLDYCFAPGVIASRNLSPSPSGQLRDFVRRVMLLDSVLLPERARDPGPAPRVRAWSSTHCIRAPATLSL